MQSRSETDAAGEGIPQHDPVPEEAVQGVPERGGTVLLEEEMAYPGEAVPGQRQGQQQPAVHGDDGQGEQQQNQQAAAVMQAAADVIAVLAQIEGVELGEGSEFPLAGPALVVLSAVGVHLTAPCCCPWPGPAATGGF